MDPIEYAKQDALAHETRLQAAHAHGFDSYWRWARNFDCTHAFFWPLLARPNAASLALVVESRLGALSGALARRYSRVISLHRHHGAATLTRTWLDSRSIRNVEIVVCDPQSLRLDGLQFDAVILFGPDEDPCEQWQSDVTRLHAAVLNIATRRSLPRGELIIGANNRWGYLGDSGRITGTGLSLSSTIRNVAGNFDATRVFVGTSRITPEFSPPPDMIEWHSALPPSASDQTFFGRAKCKLIATPAARRFWPSFMIIGSRSEDPSQFSQIVAEGELAESMCWPRGAQVIAKRIVAGNHGITVIIAGPSDNDEADVIVRIADQPEAVSFCKTNLEALGELSLTCWRKWIPAVVWHKHDDGTLLTVETKCTGFEAFSSEPGFRPKLGKACKFLAGLHGESTARAVFTQADYDRLVAKYVWDLAGYCNSNSAAQLERIDAQLRSKLIGRAFSRGVVHGDFKLGNILFDGDGAVTGIIDWDSFRRDGFQVSDYLTMALYMIGHDCNIGHEEVFLRHILPWDMPREFLGCVAPGIERLSGEQYSFSLLRVAFWFTHLYARYSGTYKLHPMWQSRMVESVLPQIETVLEKGA